MKLIPTLLPCTLRSLLWLLAFGLCSHVAHAASYASGNYTNGDGNVYFFMNDGGATVSVKYEDNSTYEMGELPKGLTNFPLGLHTSYAITCTKAGDGTPALISSDTFSNSIWANPGGVAVNSNPKIGRYFGRIYALSRGTGGYGPGTPGYKAQGIYMFNPDQTTAGQGTDFYGGTNSYGGTTFAASGTDGPWRCRVAPDGTLLVNDFSTASAALWQFQPDLSSSNLVLDVIGQNAGVTAGIHGDMFGTPQMTGSLEEGNLVLWTADGRLPVPETAVRGPGTSAGSYNCVFRYDIGSGPLPWNRPPDYAFTLGLDGIAGLRTEMTLGKDGKIFTGFGRANMSNPNIQVLDPTGSTVLYTSWDSTGGRSDPWAGINGSGTVNGTYKGIRVSPDGRFFASADYNHGITVANLRDGVPDDGSIFPVKNAPNTASSLYNARGALDWDIANNLYITAQNQLLLRIWSLGITSTCITSNDWTGTNGSFTLILPNVSASVAKIQDASQNYTNNATNPGNPIPGIFRLTLSTNSLSERTVIAFNRGGTANYPSNYTLLNFYTNASGVEFYTNRVVFPAGNSPSGNWSADVQITPTPSPVSGPTLTATLGIIGGANYVAGTPGNAALAIANTGPQLLLLSNAPAGGTMFRGNPNDYAKFVVTRWGDTNGPNNSPGNIIPQAYTVTNVNYYGTAVYPTDYTAQAQVFTPGQLPQNGASAILINPGDVQVTCLVGNPVPHTDLSLPPVNATIVLNLTNAASLVSQEGLPYQVNTANVSLTILDNAVGPESVVFYSNPMTNATDSSNWTLTFASTNLAGSTVLPVVIPNYNNNSAGNDFDVRFGAAITDDSVPQSPTMAAKGWTRALRMTVNKNNFSPAGVNVYPQGKDFKGNYALRFDMFLSMYSFALNNPNVAASLPREFALFGINHFGTNCNWRTTTVPAVPVGTGCGTTNADGVWFAIDAGAASISPADYDAFTTPALPNSGITADLVSAGSSTAAGAQVVSGYFKHPPFDVINPASLGGQPINKWVNVSVEVTRQTNCTLYMNGSSIFSFVLTNVPTSTAVAGRYTNGTVMLGYLDPVNDVSDNTAFAYFSNVRVLELSPYITNAPLSLIATQGQNVSFASGANLGTAPITNTWYQGAVTGLGVPTLALQTNTADATWIASTLAVDNVQNGTNFMAVFSDAAGSVTSTVAILEVIRGPTNATVTAGSTFAFRVTATGNAAPTAYRWRFNNNTIANNTHYAGTTTATLWITNVQPSDAGTYSIAVTNAAGYVIPSATLTVTGPPANVVVTPATQSKLWGENASFTVTASGAAPFAYQWKKGGVDLVDGGNISGATTNILTLAAITRANEGSYTAGVTNSEGGAVSSAGVLTVLVPPPTFSTVALAGADLVLSFTSTNIYDTTNAFILQSSPVVEGPYTNSPASFIFTNNAFQVTVPQVGGNMFYRLLHVE